jgi:inhibitor of KinA sporulation pathway (predicted exonuclease)
LINVVDVEATCWEGQPPPGQVNEIIEIGLTVVDLGQATRLARHSILVRPQRSRVSPFCTKLTSLTQEEVDQGVTFAEACKILARDHESATRPWASWGDYDRNQFTRQCRHTNTEYPFSGNHTNAKVKFTQAHDLRKRPGMAQALEIAGLPLEGRHHRGDDDSWNIAALVLHLQANNAW